MKSKLDFLIINYYKSLKNSLIILGFTPLMILSFSNNSQAESPFGFRDDIQEQEFFGSLCKSNESPTYPKSNYSSQKCSDTTFDVANWEIPKHNSFGYQDPQFSELDGYNILNPLKIPELRDYKVIIVINKDTNKNFGVGQRVQVYARDYALSDLSPSKMKKGNLRGLLYYWKTSTGVPGHETPVGLYNIQGFSPNHQSSKYGSVDMYWALFFNGDIALHSFNEFEMTFASRNLGKKSSHGCTRLQSHRAQRLYHLVGQVGTDLVPATRKGKVTGDYAYKYSTLIIVTDKNYDLKKAVAPLTIDEDSNFSY